jgi:ATP-binding cassette subfamily F protein 3
VFGAHQAKRILRGLGFDESDADRPIRELSGGWRMRAHLAALLFQRPDVLLLDEPTNHLDMPSVSWLSAFIRGSKHAIVLTCHDKGFLNRHVRRIASLEIEGLTLFRGNYDEYLEQRAINLEYLERRIAKDEQRKRELEAFVERFKAKATKARQAQSRVRMIEKLEEDHVELPKVRRSISIRFAPTARSGDIVIRTKGLEHGFGERPLFRGLDLTVRRGERVALVGRNGAGKTTLLKLLAGELSPWAGSIELGQNAKASYFAQHHAETLSPGRTILDEVWASCPTKSQTEVRGLCGAFLFGGDDVEKEVGVLSGGEKTRVALAKILVDPQNLLLLDEPTNHLDTESAEKLTDSLLSFDGTMIFVSHDLDFARRLSTIVWNVDRGVVTTFPGSLTDYLEELARLDAERDREVEERTVDPAKAARIDARKKKTELDRKRSSLERKIEKEEERIAALEREKAELEQRLADPATHSDVERSRALALRYEAVGEEIEAAMERWAALSME